MNYLVIEHEGGTIVGASVQAIANAATYQADGYLAGSDGRQRPLLHPTLLFDPEQPWLADLMNWWRDGKYYLDMDTDPPQIVLDSQWTPPAPPPPPEEF